MLTLQRLQETFIHSVDCLTRGPRPFTRPVLRRVRSSASSFKLQYPLVSLRSPSSCLRFLPRLPVTSSFRFPSITCFIRQFLRKMWPAPLAFLLFIVCRIWHCSSILCNTSFFTQSFQPIFSITLQQITQYHKRRYEDGTASPNSHNEK